MFVVTGLAFFAFTAAAEAGVYEGRIKGVPGTGFDLTVSKTDGKRYVERIDNDSIPVTCANGPSAITGNTTFGPPGLRVKKDGAFDTRLDFQNGDFVRYAGELKRGGRAAGIYKHRVTFPQPQGICQTAKLEWVAKKP